MEGSGGSTHVACERQVPVLAGHAFSAGSGCLCLLIEVMRSHVMSLMNEFEFMN